MGFAVVAAAGSMLGGLAAKKIMGKQSSYAPDTSIPGISSAVIKKGGKGGAGEVSVAQADISQSLAWFKEAAVTQDAYYTKGLNLYGESLKQAALEVKAGYQKANETLQPLSWSSNQALNESMRMMGLDPISSTINAPQHAVEAGYSADLSKQISAANKMKDPTERQAAFASINDQMKAIYDKPSTYEADLNALGARPQVWRGNAADVLGRGLHDMTMRTSFNSIQDMAADASQYDSNKQYQWGYDPANAKYLLSAKKLQYNAQGGESGQTAYEYDKGLIERDLAAAKAWDEKQQRLQSEESARLALLPGQQAFAAQYNNDFTPEYDKGYTGQEVADRVASTPGYQFQLEQGTAAVERQGAAKGMLGSGNTLVALDTYGQGLAQNFYGVYMNNLANIVNMGSGATMQIANNQVNEGKDYGSLHEAYGNAAMNTNQKIGDAYANSLYKSGQLYADTAMFNASAQNQGIQGAANRAASSQNAATAAAPAAQSAQTEANRFNYGVTSDQQSASAYGSGASNGGPTAGGVNYNPNTGQVSYV